MKSILLTWLIKNFACLPLIQDIFSSLKLLIVFQRNDFHQERGTHYRLTLKRHIFLWSVVFFGHLWPLLFFTPFPCVFHGCWPLLHPHLLHVWAIIFISVPSQAPDFVIAETSNSTSLVVKWRHLPEENFRGQPIGYYVTFFPADLENDINFVKVNFASNNTILSNLTAYTTYLINVSAVSPGGIGPAHTIKARTQAAGNLKTSKLYIFLYLLYKTSFATENYQDHTKHECGCDLHSENHNTD